MNRSPRFGLVIFVSLLLASRTLEAGCGPRAQPTREGAQSPQDRPGTLDPAESCTAKCHQELVKGPVVHDPIVKQGCAVCHKQANPRDHEFTAIDDVPLSCKACHDLKLKEIVHSPVKEGDCTICHDPHRSDAKGLLRSKDEPALCRTCHSEASFAKKAHVHGPVVNGKCTLCHSPHSASHAKLIEAEPTAFCLKCHGDMAERIKEATHVHGPIQSDCGLCHDAHASDQPNQLKDAVRPLCLHCHMELQDQITASQVKHGAMTSGRDCLNCHDAHIARFRMLLVEPVKTMCLSCHDKELPRPDGKPVTAITKLLENSKFLHGPIREGNCSGCHEPHASPHVSLARQAYPKRFYAPYDAKDYDLCFACHDAKVFSTEKTTSLTSFRDADRNLHFVHVNQKKGRTCRACHEVHASNLPKHLAQSVPFGDWSMPINFTQTATGGSCAPGCHKVLTYDNTKVLPGSGQTPEKRQ